MLTENRSGQEALAGDDLAESGFACPSRAAYTSMQIRLLAFRPHPLYAKKGRTKNSLLTLETSYTHGQITGQLNNTLITNFLCVILQAYLF